MVSSPSRSVSSSFVWAAVTVFRCVVAFMLYENKSVLFPLEFFIECARCVVDLMNVMFWSSKSLLSLYSGCPLALMHLLLSWLSLPCHSIISVALSCVSAQLCVILISHIYLDRWSLSVHVIELCGAWDVKCFACSVVTLCVLVLICYCLARDI